MAKNTKIFIIVMLILSLIIFLRLTIIFSDKKTVLKEEMLSVFTEEEIAAASIIDVYLESPDKYSNYIEKLTAEEFLLHTKYTIVMDKIHDAPVSWFFVIFLAIFVLGLLLLFPIIFTILDL